MRRELSPGRIRGSASQPGFDNSTPSQLVQRFDTTIFRICRLCIIPHRRSRCKRNLPLIKRFLKRARGERICKINAISFTFEIKFRGYFPILFVCFNKLLIIFISKLISFITNSIHIYFWWDFTKANVYLFCSTRINFPI